MNLKVSELKLTKYKVYGPNHKIIKYQIAINTIIYNYIISFKRL